jgi:hypothetical protein
MGATTYIDIGSSSHVTPVCSEDNPPGLNSASEGVHNATTTIAFTRFSELTLSLEEPAIHRALLK